MKKLAILAVALAFAAPVHAEDAIKTFTLTLKDHKFDNEALEVPAGEKFKLVVKNTDGTAEEFESKSLKREKVVAANSEITLLVGPLKAGEYPFVGEYHENSGAAGKIIAK